MKTIFLVHDIDLYYYRFLSNSNSDIFCAQTFKKNKFLFFVARVIRKLGWHVPFVFYSDWVKHIEKAEKIIITDYGYCKGIEKYILKKNKECKIYFYYMNNMHDCGKKFNSHIFNVFSKQMIYSFDPIDSKKEGITFMPTPYYKIDKTSTSHKYDLFFLGRGKNRESLLTYLFDLCKLNNLSPNILVMGENVDSRLKLNSYMSYLKYLDLVCESSTLLEVVSKNQSGISLRTLEGIFFEKKIITNNKYIKSYEFYDSISKNVLIIDEKNLDEEEIINFIKQPYEKVSLDKSKYEFEKWVNNF